MHCLLWLIKSSHAQHFTPSAQLHEAEAGNTRVHLAHNVAAVSHGAVELYSTQFNAVRSGRLLLAARHFSEATLP
jgi:hypothetical protein